jgi:hypothetical protein
MRYFPTVCIEDFFDDPDAVRNYALSLDYPENPGHYPGRRSLDLRELNPEFYNNFCKRLFEIYFDEQPDDWSVECRFQLIEKQHEDKNSIKNTGWIHKDLKCMFGGIVYLNPDADLDSGTAIYKKIKEEEQDIFARKIKEKNSIELKKLFFTHKKDEGYEETLSEWNSGYIETARFANIYNRLISFESTQYHAATSLYVTDQPRLTLVFFANGVHPQVEPKLKRVKDIPCFL